MPSTNSVDNETYGHQLHVPDEDLGDYPENDRHYDGSGRVIDLDHLMIHGQERSDRPVPGEVSRRRAARPKGSIHVSFPTGIQTDTTALGAETITTHREHRIMPNHEVIVGNVGSVYYGKSRIKALATYKSYVESSKEHVGARCHGEDVTLLVDGEIEAEHTGHLRQE